MKESTARAQTSEIKSVSEQLIEICGVPVSAEARHKAAVHLLDWLGCILSGATTAPGEGLRKFSQLGQFTPGKSFVCGQKCLSASGAAFVNGGLGNILEMDDVHRASILHAGDIIIPAALATAQENEASLSRLLESIVRGYEIALRLGSLAATGGYSNWYNSGTCGIFGAAFASAHVLELNKQQLKDCLGQAGMFGSGLWQCRLEPTWSKQLASANAASNGVMAAYFGQQNFPGARFIFEGEAGFFSTYYPKADIARLNLKPVETWLLHDVSFKPWPACRHNHTIIEAALRFREQHTIEDVVEIELETYRAAIDFCDNSTPATDHDARFSLQHCVAVALLRGEPSISDFAKDSRNDASISDLRKKVTLTVDEGFDNRFPQHMGAAMSVTRSDGERISIKIDNARGDPENPMSLDDIKLKFYSLASVAGVTRQHADFLVSTLLDDRVSDFRGSSANSLHVLNDALSKTVDDMR